MNRRAGYLKGNRHLVSWFLDTLPQLSDTFAYSLSYAKWRYEDLAILSENSSFRCSTRRKVVLPAEKTNDTVQCVHPSEHLRRRARGRFYLPHRPHLDRLTPMSKMILPKPGWRCLQFILDHGRGNYYVTMRELSFSHGANRKSGTLPHRDTLMQPFLGRYNIREKYTRAYYMRMKLQRDFSRLGDTARA